MSNPALQSWNPRLYDRAGAFVPELGAELIALLAPQAGERVLDVGCGTGDLTARLAESGAQLVGLDASPQMVEEARRKHPGLEVRLGDGQELDFDAEFDAVFSNAALHWMPRADEVARGVLRALRPGGRFVAELGGAGCVLTVRQAVQDSLIELGELGRGTPDWFFPSVGQYATRLEQAGLWVRSAVWFERPTPLPGPDGLATWLRMFCAPLLDTLGDRQHELLARVTNRCTPRLYRDDVWWLDYTRVRVVASKPRGTLQVP